MRTDVNITCVRNVSKVTRVGVMRVGGDSLWVSISLSVGLSIVHKLTRRYVQSKPQQEGPRSNGRSRANLTGKNLSYSGKCHVTSYVCLSSHGLPLPLLRALRPRLWCILTIIRNRFREGGGVPPYTQRVFALVRGCMYVEGKGSEHSNTCKIAQLS